MTGRDLSLGRLGGEPGRYAVAALVLSVLWFLVRLFVLDRGDPLSEVILAAGMSGAVWAVFPVVADLAARRGRGPAPVPTGSLRRRGALTGLAVAVPLFGGLAAYGISVGAQVLYPLFFVLVLLVVVTVALRNLRHAAAAAPVGDTGGPDPESRLT